MTATGVSVSFETMRRYQRLRQDSQYRQGLTELHNDEFMTLLMDVWELHLEQEGAPSAAIDADAEVVAGD